MVDQSSELDESKAQNPSAVGSAAVAVATVGLLLVLLAQFLAVAHPATGSEDLSGVPLARIVGLIVAVAVPLLGLVGIVRRRFAFAGGLLAGAGVVSIGLVVLDVQLFDEPIDANRFELLRPVTAADLSPGPGAYCVLAGHILAVVAGLLAMVTVSRAALGDGYGDSDDPELSGRAVSARAGWVWSAVAVVAALAFGALMFPSPWSSADDVVVTTPVVEASGIVLAATLILSAAVLAVIVGAPASASPDVTAGALVGAGIVAFGIAGSRLAAAIGDDHLDATGASIAAAIVAVVLLLIGVGLPGLVAIRDRRAAKAAAEVDRGQPALEHITTQRWHVLAGAGGVITALLIGIGALLPILSVPDGTPSPDFPITKVALVAAIVLIIGSIWLFLSEFAATVRPALGLLTIAVVMVGFAVLNRSVQGNRADGVGVGAGSILVAIGVVAAIVTGLLVLLAGSAERDDVDRSADVEVNRPVAILGGVAAAVSVAALGFPLYRGSNGSAASFGLPLGWDSWGQIVFAVAVVLAVVIAARARPARAAALIAGAAAGMVIYLIGWPVTVGSVADASVGVGAPMAIAGVILLLTTSVVAVRGRATQKATGE